MTINETTKKTLQQSPEPGDLLTFNILNEIKIQFSRIPTGDFTMGSSEQEQGHKAEESPLCPYFQNRDIQCLVCYQFTQLGILLLNSTQLLNHIRAHSAVLLTPAIIGLLTDF